jgi:hypothetical protein
MRSEVADSAERKMLSTASCYLTQMVGELIERATVSLLKAA